MLGGIPSAFSGGNDTASTSSGGGVLGSITSMFPGAADEENNLCPSLSYNTRVKGFVGCFVSGFVLSFIGGFMLSVGNMKAFIVLYTFGNIIAMSGTMFLMGPKRQCQTMWKPVRAAATAVYLIALVATVVVAFSSKKALPVIILLVIQFCAGVWYSASYIPYARKMIMSCMSSTFG